MTIKRHMLVLFVVLAFGCGLLSFCLSKADIVAAQVSSEEGLYTVALGAYKNGFFDIAIDQFYKFLNLYPKSHKAPFAWFRIGEGYRVQNKDALAQEAYQNLLDLYPGHILTHMALFHLAGLRFNRQDYASALSDYQRLLKETQSIDLAQKTRFWLAETLYQLKKYPEALAAYQTFVSESPNHDLVHQALSGAGWCLMELDRYDEAAEQFRRLLEKNPPDDLVAQTHLKLGDALFELKDFEGSLKHYAVYTTLRPEERHRVILRQGFALSHIGQDGEAVKIFRDFINSAPKDDTATAEVFFYSGQSYYKLKKYEDAIISFQSFLNECSDHPMIPEAKYRMAQCYLKMEKVPLAMELFKEIIETFPDLEKAYQASLYMGNLYYQQDRTQEAIDYYSKAAYAKDHSLAAEAGYRLAESFILMGDQEKAVREFQAIEAFHPDQSMWIQMGRFRTGNIYEQAGDTERAISIYNKVVTMKDVTGDLAQAAQERIEAISKGLGDQNRKETMPEKKANNNEDKP